MKDKFGIKAFFGAFIMTIDGRHQSYGVITGVSEKSIKYVDSTWKDPKGKYHIRTKHSSEKFIVLNDEQSTNVLKSYTRLQGLQQQVKANLCK